MLITAESGVASGVRRIEAVTGELALDLVKQSQIQLNDVCFELKANPQNLIEKAGSLRAELKGLEERDRALEAKASHVLRW